MTQTDIANLALSKIGESLIDSLYDSDNKAARLALLHYDPALRETLRAHFWGFAMVSSAALEASAGDNYASAILDPTGSNNEILLTARSLGTAGNAIRVTVNAPAARAADLVNALGTAIVITPATKRRMQISGLNVAEANALVEYVGEVNGYHAFSSDGTLDETPTNVRLYHENSYWALRMGAVYPLAYHAQKVSTAEFPDGLTGWTLISPLIPSGGFPTITAGDPSTATELVASINGDAAASLLVSASNAPGSTGAGGVGAVVETPLANGSSNPPGWTKGFLIPDDFIKLRKVLTSDGSSIDRFDFRRIKGERCIVTGDYESISLEYVQFLDDPDAYDPLFIAAFVTLLASKLARAISGDTKLESQLLAEYERNALLNARLADAHDTQSNENHPLQEILDGALINSFGNHFPRL
jgi:hypothetical protein